MYIKKISIIHLILNNKPGIRLKTASFALLGFKVVEYGQDVVLFDLVEMADHVSRGLHSKHQVGRFAHFRFYFHGFEIIFNYDLLKSI